jgi:pimeloyl-ACP methyl ester carboxylesterase
MDYPDVHYALSDDLNIAYTISGAGPVDLVYAPGTVSHVEFDWEDPYMSRFFRRLGAFARVIKFDKRGTGLSDRTGATFTLQERSDDIRAVMDAAGVERAHLVGVSEGGAMCMLYAATYPQRTLSLSLVGANARYSWAPDFPWGQTQEQYDAFVEYVRTGRDEQEMDLSRWAPSIAADRDARRYYMSWARRGASPGALLALEKMNMGMDATGALPAIRVPTLVVHRKDDVAVPVANATYIADRVAGAQLVLLDGADHFPWAGDTESICAAVEEFITGQSFVYEPERVFATVMFTDIVESTVHAVALGDRRWHDLLDRHDRMMQREISRHRGRLVKGTGDGVFATFDGPGRAIRCASAIVGSSQALGIEIRAGLHAGEVELRGDDLAGVAVHTGARVSAAAGAGEVLVSSTVKDLVAGSGIGFFDRGLRQLKGVPGEWRLWAVDQASV